MVAMAEAASDRHGCLLHRPAYRVLCGQRQEPATVEGASGNRILVAAGRYRSTADPQCPASAQAGPRLRSRTIATYAICKFGLRRQCHPRSDGAVLSGPRVTRKPEM